MSLTISYDKDHHKDNEHKEVSDFIETYAKIVSANYKDTYKTAVTMQNKINSFLTSPSQSTLKDAKKSWLYARNFYGQTEAYREANGPIDNEDLLGIEGQINAWPLDEGYIDYVATNSSGTKIIQNGLIGDTSFELTELNIIAKNEEGKDDNISTGWHTIEFLLWGQDLNYNPNSRTSDNFATSGNRPFTDFITENFASRRKNYLKIITNLLIKNLKDLNDTWAEEGSYRITFENLSEDEALTNILNGIGFISNGEVALERLDPAIDEGQENEHSCFSDNTNKDLWANVTGINNIINGSYTSENGVIISGTSLINIVKEKNTYTANNLKNKAEDTLVKLNNLLGLYKSFDEIVSTETLGSGGPAGNLSSALKVQGSAISDAAATLGVNITIN